MNSLHSPSVGVSELARSVAELDTGREALRSVGVPQVLVPECPGLRAAGAGFSAGLGCWGCVACGLSHQPQRETQTFGIGTQEEREST